jgi:hypothetical protein
MELVADINNNRICYRNNKFREEIEKFKKKNEGKKILIQFKIADTPEFFQHKYYRGYLLPDITRALGEMDQEYVHRYILKKQFLFKEMKELNKISMIPQKYRAKCVMYTAKVKKDNKEFDVVYGYSPSIADLTFREFYDYIIQCEHLFFIDLNSHIGVNKSGEQFEIWQNEAKKWRNFAMNFSGEDVTSDHMELNFDDIK